MDRDDPDREGLVSTPSRVVRAFDDWYSGYRDDPIEFLRRTFHEVDGYDEMIVLRDIHFESHCEHHMAPIIGKVHIGICPTAPSSASASSRGWSRTFARRLQVQETLTAQIAHCIQGVLKAARRRRRGRRRSPVHDHRAGSTSTACR
jgi:GTP cyclohydrolase I